MDIRDATPEEERAFFGHNDPCMRELKAGVEDGKVIAMSGVMRDPRYHGSIFEEDGRWIGFLQLAPDVPPLGFQPVLAMRHWLKSQREEIIVQCDDALPKAEKLLGVLGFTRTDEVMADFRRPGVKLRIWTWRPQQQSPA
jgi:hypothetical protein